MAGNVKFLSFFDYVEDRRRLSNAQINLDNFDGASAIEYKFSWHSACSKFGIVFGLHYLCAVND